MTSCPSFPDVTSRAETPRVPAEALGDGDTIEFMAERSSVVTHADLATFPDDGLRREIIAGELIVSPSPRTRHQRISARLVSVFYNHIAASGGGELFFAPFDVVLSDIDVVEPDILFVAEDQREILTDANVQGAPALVIEVLSDPRIDRVRKRDLYARFGVPEYWVVDPEADRVEVYRPAGDAYAKPEIFEPGETLTFGGLPGLEIDLNQIFAR